MRSGDKRAQSALEYMMTYGWAILIIVIVAAVLYSFGIFNPSSNVTSAPLITGFSDVPVTSAAVNSSFFKVTITDQYGQTIRINNVTLLDGSQLFTVTNCTNIVLLQGQYTGCYVKGTFLESTVSVVGNIHYTVINSLENLTSTGTIRLGKQTGPLFAGSGLSGTALSTFTESGIASGLYWTVVYDSLINSSNLTTIVFNTSSGPHSFSIMNDSTSGCFIYAANVSSGTLNAGSSINVGFSETTGSCVITTFSESGLPKGALWSVVYAGSLNSSVSSSIAFSTASGNFYYSIPSKNITSAGCYSIYSPTPSSGTFNAGSTKPVAFSLASSTCTNTIFTESGLPSNYNWSASYDGTRNSSVSTTISFLSNSGAHSFSVYNESNWTAGCRTNYTASPSAGSLSAGTPESVSFSHATSCSATVTTTFTEIGLPSGYNWNATYGPGTGILNSSTTPQITFNTSSANYAFKVYNHVNSTGLCTTTYTVNKSSGTLAAGSTIHLSFAGATRCLTTFTEAGIPANILSAEGWTVYYGGTYDSAFGTSITFNVINSTYSYTAEQQLNQSYNSGCAGVLGTTIYSPSPSSGALAAGKSQLISYSASTSCNYLLYFFNAKTSPVAGQILNGTQIVANISISDLKGFSEVQAGVDNIGHAVFDSNNGDMYSGYTNGTGADYIAVIKGSTDIANIKLAQGGSGNSSDFLSIVYDSSNHLVYASSYNYGTIYIINNTRLVGSIQTGLTFQDAIYNPNNGDVYFASGGCLYVSGNGINCDNPADTVNYSAVVNDTIAVVNGLNLVGYVYDTTVKHPFTYDMAFDSNNSDIYVESGSGIEMISGTTITHEFSAVDAKCITYNPHYNYVYSVLERNAMANLQIMDNTTTLYNASIPGVNGYYHLIYDVEFDPVNNYTYVYKNWMNTTSYIFNTTMEVFNGLTSIANITQTTGIAHIHLSASAVDPSTGYLYMFFEHNVGNYYNITTIQVYSGTSLLTTISDNIPNYLPTNGATAAACNGNGVIPVSGYG